MSLFSLSPLQEARWTLLQSEPRFDWSVSLTLGLHGPLEPEALRAALERLVERHEILRTRLVVGEGGAPMMSVEPAGSVRLELRDWSAGSRAQREVDCRAFERELRAHDPEGGTTPLRVGLASIETKEHVLVLAQSVLAADWRSLWCLTQELLAVLAGERTQEEAVQFADLAQWQRNTLEGEDAAGGFQSWGRLELSAAHELHLALEHDRGTRPFEFLEHSRELPRGLDDALLQLARGRGLPVEALLCAVWQTCLARLGENDHPLLGVSSAGRAFQGLDEALGTFERALPVGARLDERVNLLQLARLTDEQLARGAEWHEFFQPERLGAARDFAFPHGFAYLPLLADHTRGALRAEVLRRGGHGERFRCLLRVEETMQGSELCFALDSRWFSPADAAALAEPFLALLENAIARPEAPLAGLPACTPTRHAQLYQLARGSELPGDSPHARQVMHEWILEVARKTPGAVAVRAGETELDYAALEQRSAALARELASLGIAPGSFVGVHLERSVDLIVALLAVLRAGCAYVPLPPAYPRERVLTMLADSHAPAVIGTAASRAELEGFRGAFVSIQAPRATALTAPALAVTPAERAYLIYTSGSSGKPKGVPISHANLVYSTRARLAAYPERVERYLLLSSFAFDSSVAGIFWTLVSGGTLVLPPEGFEKDLAGLPALIARERPTHVLCLPSLWSLMLEQAPEGALDSLTTVIVAGESCPLELVRRHQARLARTRLYNEYGPTEGTVWSTVFDTSRPFERTRVPIGRPIPGSMNYVLTPERELAPIGVAGELWIAGPGVAAGYLDRPELTNESFAEDPFGGGLMYRTGDRARLLPDGNLEFLGRLDHQVKIRGFRIELAEIESVLSSHPAVREAIVLAREDGPGAARLVAYATAIGPRPAETDLLRYLAERLPEYMVPARALCLEDWPRLPNGKLDRNALPLPDESASFAEPEGALEIVLAALWADVLGLEQVGRRDDFFALGGHSLSATRLYARLKETLQIGLPLRALFEHRTPEALAGELRRDPAQRTRVETLAEMVLGVLEAESEEQVLGA